MARPERFELPTTWFVARYSIQLSYGRGEQRIMRIGRCWVKKKFWAEGRCVDFVALRGASSVCASISVV